MEFSLDMNIKLGEKNHKHVAIVSIRRAREWRICRVLRHS